MSYVDNFWLEFENTIVIFQNQRFRICLKVTFCAKIKIHNFRVKNTFFGELEKGIVIFESNNLQFF